MNFHDTTLSAIVASLIAAGLIALTSYAWKNRVSIRDKFRKEPDPPVENIGLDAYTKNFHGWVSEDCIHLSVSQEVRNRQPTPITYYNVVGVELIRNPRKLNELILTVVDGQKKIVFANDTEIERIIRTLYFRSVFNG